MDKEQEKEENQENSSIKPKKSRQQIYQENYQKNKEKKKEQQRIRYQQQKKQAEIKAQQEKEQAAEYYGAESISILMSLKEWTELNPAKKKHWADFCWTLRDYDQAAGNIIAVMKLAEAVNKVVRDYWVTVRSELREKGKSWNSLSTNQQSKLIKFWGREKARKEKNFLTTSEQLDQQGKEREEELALAKFHEERGKIKCECWQCQGRKEIQAEVKKEQKKSEKEQEQPWDVVNCAGCERKVRIDKFNEEGLCKKCAEKFE